MRGMPLPAAVFDRARVRARRHAKEKVNCLDCHAPADQQQGMQHHGFLIVAKLTAANCRGCHESIYQEFLRSHG
jgi:hypothetical protein